MVFDEQPANDGEFRVELSKSELRTIQDRLRVAIKLGGGNAEVARKSGVSTTTLHSYLNGSELKLGSIIRISEACGVRAVWLAFGLLPYFSAVDAPIGAGESEPLDDYLPIRRFGVQASAGHGSLIDNEQVVEHLAFKADWLRRHVGRSPEQLVLIEARGDSMEPTIGDGDLLLVDTSATDIATSAIHVLNVEGELLVKRLERRLDRSVVVRSDNPRYAEQIITQEDRKSLVIVGQVLWRGAPVR